MGSYVGQIFPTASLHRDHSISYALVCEKEISHMGKNNGNPDLVCEKVFSCCTYMGYEIVKGIDSLIYQLIKLI